MAPYYLFKTNLSYMQKTWRLRRVGRPTRISQFLTNFLWPKAITHTVLVMLLCIILNQELLKGSRLLVLIDCLATPQFS